MVVKGFSRISSQICSTGYGDRVANANSRLSVNFKASVMEVDFARHEIRIEQCSGSL
jgi:hypothetical protein